MFQSLHTKSGSGRFYHKLQRGGCSKTLTQLRTNSDDIEEEQELDEKLDIHEPTNLLKRPLLVGLVVLLWLVLMAVLAFWYHQQNRLESACPKTPQSTPGSPSISLKSAAARSPCGNTSAEAIARGCRMESMFYGWIPPECYYQELSTQYSPFTDRRWYTIQDQSEKYLVDSKELEVGDHQLVWATNYHKSHCLFLWRKLALAVEQQKPWIDSRTANREHSDHCAEILDEMPENPHQITRVKLSFYSCVSLPWGQAV